MRKLHTSVGTIFSAALISVTACVNDQGGLDASNQAAPNVAKSDTGDISRVWTQLSQHLIANMYTMLWKLSAVFSKRVASLRMSFILQKNRSTMLRMA